MKKIISTTILALSLMAAGFTLQAADPAAGDQPPAEKPAKKKSSNHLPFHGTVGAVDKSAKTITLEGKEKSRAFQVTSETRIHKEGKPATFDDVAPGEHVSGSYLEKEGKLVLRTLNVGQSGKSGKTKTKTDGDQPAK